MLRRLYRALAAPRLSPITPTCSSTGSRAPNDVRALTIATWNVAWAQGRGSEYNGAAPLRTAEEQALALGSVGAWLAAEKVDVALLQEIDEGSARSGGVDQAQVIAEQAGLPWIARGICWDVPYLPYPYWPPSAHAGKLRSGGAILSRYPIRAAWIETLPKPLTKPAWWRAFAPVRYLMGAEIALGEGRTLHAVGAHLEAFDGENRRMQAGIVSSRLASMAMRPFLVLGGDLNTIPDVSAVRHNYPDEPEADHRGDTSYRIIGETPGLTSAFAPDAIERAPEVHHTFPAHRPCRMLDHVFVGPGVRVAYARVGLEAGTASDHLPVLARLALDIDA